MQYYTTLLVVLWRVILSNSTSVVAVMCKVEAVRGNQAANRLQLWRHNRRWCIFPYYTAVVVIYCYLVIIVTFAVVYIFVFIKII